MFYHKSYPRVGGCKNEFLIWNLIELVRARSENPGLLCTINLRFCIKKCCNIKSKKKKKKTLIVANFAIDR
ncbi:hypothetical protein HanIR_Chr04g0177001 [Helianthus annuus]|nr:hypothetical protein HanIR_Chr04g0177001 [Helianthus annuus]